MAVPVVFNGSNEEKTALISALANNCACRFGPMNMRVSTCAAHNMLMTDQRALNGMICQRRRAAELLLQEFLLPRKV